MRCDGSLAPSRAGPPPTGPSYDQELPVYASRTTSAFAPTSLWAPSHPPSLAPSRPAPPLGAFATTPPQTPSRHWRTCVHPPLVPSLPHNSQRPRAHPPFTPPPPPTHSGHPVLVASCFFSAFTQHLSLSSVTHCHFPLTTQACFPVTPAQLPASAALPPQGSVTSPAELELWALPRAGPPSLHCVLCQKAWATSNRWLPRLPTRKR